MNQTKQVQLSKESSKRAIKLVNDILGSMSFFRDNISGGDLQEDEVETFMGLFESYFSELSPIVGYDSMLVQERKDRYTKIRELNTEISQLRADMGKKISSDAASGFLKNCDDIFRAWYGSYGFHYASLKNISFWGMIYEFSDEIDYFSDDGLSSRKELAEQMAKDHTIISEQAGWDVAKDKYHGSLLDTDNNKAKLRDLLKTDFPDCDIRKFESRKNDFGSFSMRVTVYLPFKNISMLGAKYETEEKK